MHEVLVKICESLNSLSELILKSWDDDRTLHEVFGWNHPALTKYDIARRPSMLAMKIKSADVNELSAVLASNLKAVPRRLQLLHPTTIPHIFNGNATVALPALTSTLDYLCELLDPIISWQKWPDSKYMPAPLLRKIKGIQADVELLVPDKNRLQEQIRQIEDATEAAESLPTDMQSLKDARSTIDRLSLESAELYGKIDQRHQAAEATLTKIVSSQSEAEKLVQQCEEAYRITTTKGLAAAFDLRASQLAWSMWFWVLGLLAALAIGAFMGSNRIELLSSAISDRDPHWGVIWMHIALSALSVGAPLWFSWLATKQIGQRFKLSEDYGFKASVAKAYEGYRREAARIDEAFEARLFSSALTRLEEAPLRLVGSADHGSPWHELVTSEAFHKAISVVPELKDKFIEVAKEGMAQAGSVIKKKTIDSPEKIE